MLLLETNAPIVAAALTPDDFHIPEHAETFERALDVLNKNAQVLDMVSLRAACAGKPGVVRFLDEMMLRGYSHLVGQSLDSAVALLKNLAVLRRVSRACLTVLGMCNDPESTADPERVLDRAGTEFSAALAEREHGVRAENIDKLMEPIVQAAMSMRDGMTLPPRQFIPAPLKTLEGMLDGLKPGQSIVIAGRPGSGKTCLGVQCAESAMDFGARAMIYSFEMSKEELAERLLAGRAQVDSKTINRRAFGMQQFRPMIAAMNGLIGKKMTVVDAARWTIEQVSRHARREHMRDPLGIIVIDYLQLIKSEQHRGKSSGYSREQEVSEISRECKLLAKELNVPVVLLAQMNREVEKRDNRPPQLSDLRESGSIEQDADVVLFVTVDQNDRTAAKIHLRKQRGGELGEFACRFDGKYARFSDRARHEQEDSHATNPRW
jgi:replicative DNA helicase